MQYILVKVCIGVKLEGERSVLAVGEGEPSMDVE